MVIWSLDAQISLIKPLSPIQRLQAVVRLVFESLVQVV